MKRQAAILISVAALALAVGLASGCDRPMFIQSDDGQNLPAPSGGPLVARSVKPVADVPLPDGFVAVQPRSKASVANGLRSVDYYYQGRANFTRILDFYRKALAEAGWQAGSEQVQGDSAILRYNKTGETLDLRIMKPDRVATVHVIIAPGQLNTVP
ncbi:MAG: hypothetical protein NTW19_18565 [Planctomycetota bacterium]|nr:hypothetical protein [Planctomycetota bacterium]